MGLYYKSTRNSNLKVTASEAILKGLAPDGGLFVPSELPKLDVTMSDLKGKTYQEIAYLVMKQFLTDFTEEELSKYVEGYITEGNFSGEDSLKIFPVAKSVELLMLNKTDWEKFSSSVGVTTEELSTIEGITETDKKILRVDRQFD